MSCARCEPDNIRAENEMLLSTSRGARLAMLREVRRALVEAVPGGIVGPSLFVIDELIAAERAKGAP